MDGWMDELIHVVGEYACSARNCGIAYILYARQNIIML